MIDLSFATKKLKKHILRINTRLKDVGSDDNTIQIFGVTNTDGVTVTGKEISKDLSNYILIEEGNLAYNPYRVNVGSIGIVPKGISGAVSPAYIVFKTNTDLNPDFLFYYLKSQLGINLIRWYGNKGGVRDALRYDDLEQIDIPDIPIDKQVTILEIISKIQDKLNVFKKEINTQENLIQSLRQAILQEAVQGKLVPQDPNDEPASELLKRIRAEKEKLIKEKKIKKEKPLSPISEDEIPYELPKGWEWVRLPVVYHDWGQKTPDEKFTYIDVASINKEEGILSDNANILDSAEAPSRARKIVRKGTVIYSTVRPYLLNIAIIDRDFKYPPIVSTAFAVIHPFEGGSKEYLYYYLRSKSFTDFVESKMVGMAYPAINDTQLRLGLFPLPPEKEQIRIVEKVKGIVKLVKELDNKVQLSKKDSENLMQAVLQESFQSK